MHLKKQHLIQAGQMFLSVALRFILVSFQICYMDVRAFSAAGVIGIGAAGRILINSIDDVIIGILLSRYNENWRSDRKEEERIEIASVMCLLKQQPDVLGAYCCFWRILLADRGRQIVSERVPELSGESNTLSGTQ